MTRSSEIFLETPDALLVLIGQQAEKGQDISPDLVPVLLAQIRILAQAARETLAITVIMNRAESEVIFHSPVLTANLPTAPSTAETITPSEKPPQKPLPDFTSIKEMALIKEIDPTRLRHVVLQAISKGENIERRGQGVKTTYDSKSLEAIADKLLSKINHPEGWLSITGFLDSLPPTTSPEEKNRIGRQIELARAAGKIQTHRGLGQSYHPPDELAAFLASGNGVKKNGQ